MNKWLTKLTRPVDKTKNYIYLDSWPSLGFHIISPGQPDEELVVVRRRMKKTGRIYIDRGIALAPAPKDRR